MNQIFQDNLLEMVDIVLVNTSHPGNIGSAARAMKTMGLSKMVLGYPESPVDEQSYALAQSLDGVEVLWILPDGEQRFTPGMAELIAPET